ncbi:MAG: glycosyltransferase family 2 protein [Lacibacter sp.]
MATPRVFIVVPAYNERADVLQTVLAALVATGHGVVLVDDGSHWHLQPVVRHLPVHYLRHRCNLGQGAALQTGTRYALQQGADLIVHFDADGQHTVADLQALLQPLQNGACDVALGSRFLERENNYVPLAKRLLLQAARYLNWMFTGLLLSDAHNGLRAMNRKAAAAIRLTENRMAHATELLFEIRRRQLRWKEVPVHIAYTPYARQKGQSAFNSIRIFFDVLLHKLFS